MTLPAQHGPDVGSIVTWLFVPGDRPDRFAKAASSGADAVVLDLEDAVAPAEKDQAREQVCRWLTHSGSGWVRVNAATTPWHAADVAALADCPGLLGLVVPKAEDPHVLSDLALRLPADTALVALVETALGVHRAVELASGAADRLAFGSIDFAGDIGADGSWDSLLHARSGLVLASRVGGVAPPVDGVTTAIGDPARLASDVAAARGLGFTGKLCIHPGQVEAVRAGFAPGADEVAWAERVLSAVGDAEGAVAVDGAMVDRPVVERARAILRRRAT